MSLISVILPTYNRRELLLRAIDSVLSQTHSELEVIVVDDASDDGTQTAVLELNDERIRYVRLMENAGACAARNRGLAMARGEYIAFQDSDDVFHPEKLEKQLAYLLETGADVTVCAMNRVRWDGEEEVFPANEGNRPLSYPELLLENLCSTQCILARAEVFEAVRFDEQLPRLQDWDVMLRISRQFRVMLDARPLVDVYLQPDSISQQPHRLLIALRRLYVRYRADICSDQLLIVREQRVDVRWIRSICGVAEMCGEDPWTQDMLDNAPDWVYHRGEAAQYARTLINLSYIRHGSYPMPDTLVLNMNLHYFMPAPGTRFLPLPLLRDALRCNPDGASFDGQWNGRRYDQLSEAICQLSYKYSNRLVWEVLSDVYGGVCVAAVLAATELTYMRRWAEALQGLEIRVRTGAVRRIGVYYHSLRNGGVQQAAAAQIRLWVQMGYEVTLVTASEPTEEDYPLPEKVTRKVIPAFDPQRPELRSERVHALVRAIRDCDLLVYHAWADPMILFELLAVRSAGIRFLIHTHSVFTMPLMDPLTFDRFLSLPDVYALSDGVVTLSEVDRLYWSQVNARVYATVNPLTYDPKTVRRSPLNGRTVLWAGRISDEKRPMDASIIMQHVCYVLPDARLIMVGSGDDALMDALRGNINACGLAGKVELVGFKPDLREYYEQADVFLCTSRYEGFCLTIAEAMTFGVPVVTYDMPYLTTLQHGGHISVPQADVFAAKNALIRLLTDVDLRRKLGDEARENVLTWLSLDQKAIWKRILDDQVRYLPPMVLTNVQSTMLRTLREHIEVSHPLCSIHPSLPTVQTTFVPLPDKGPAKTLRKKTATFLQVLLIHGPKGIRQVLRQRKKAKGGTTDD